MSQTLTVKFLSSVQLTSPNWTISFLKNNQEAEERAKIKRAPVPLYLVWTSRDRACLPRKLGKEGLSVRGKTHIDIFKNLAVVIK